MPVVFYVLGMVFAAICANITYALVTARVAVYTAMDVASFEAAQNNSIAIALGSGIISAIFISTGAITQILLSRRDAE